LSWSLRPGEDDSSAGQYGLSVAGVGDVNGDGFADVAVGAPFALARELAADGSVMMTIQGGRVYVHHGTSAGPPTLASWIARMPRPGAQFGRSVAGGDLNGDGYDDLIAGSPWWGTSLNRREGRAVAYLGSAGGLSDPGRPDWETGHTAPIGTRVGHVVASSDANADGYADIIVGVPQHFGGGFSIYFGNGSLGVTARPVTVRPDDERLVQPRACPASDGRVRLRVHGRTPAGRGRVRGQFEVKPATAPFDGTGLLDTAWADAGVAGISLEVVLHMPPGDYQWRVRLQYEPRRAAFGPFSRWIYHATGEPLQPASKWWRTGAGVGEEDVCIGGRIRAPRFPACCRPTLAASSFAKWNLMPLSNFRRGCAPKPRGHLWGPIAPRRGREARRARQWTTP
jgi:hypothetical protein